MSRYIKIILTVSLFVVLSGMASAQSVVHIPAISKAPIIDGVMTPGEWDSAAVTCGFKILATGLPAQAPVVAHMCYNNYALFIAWECKGEPLDKLVGKPAQRDSQVWADSSVELFLTGNKWPQSKYAHLMVNYIGAMADEMCNGGAFDATWNPEWNVKTGKTADSYIVEMAIPWSILDVVPEAGIQIRGNLTRNTAALFTGAGEATTWAKMGGGFHQPESFGTFVLAGNGTVAQINELPKRNKGVASVTAKLINKTDGYTLSMKPVIGKGKNGKLSRSSFGSSDTAKTSANITFGTGDLLVQVKDSKGNIIWSQTQNMAIPDITGKLANIRTELKTLSKMRSKLVRQYGESSQVVSTVDKTIADTDSDIVKMEARSKADLSIDELIKLRDELDAPAGRSSNIMAAIEFAGFVGSDNGTVPGYYVTNPVSTQKIFRAVGEAGPSAKTLHVSMMKNEFEPVQIVICPTSGALRNVMVTASSLTNPDGATIPADRLIVTPMAYVNCKESTPGAPYKGWIPDVLLPNKPVNVSKDNRQPYFVTVHTTAADTPGNYTGKVKISVEGAETVELPLQVKVYDVTLPVRSSLRTVFLLDWAIGSFLDGLSMQDVRINYSKTMLEHRLSASSSINPKKMSDGTWDFSELDQYLNELVPLGQTTIKVPTDIDALKAQADYMKKRNVWDLHYLYGWDEAGSDVLARLQEIYKTYTDAVPDVKVMQTGWNPNPKLKNLVKIWCPLTASADMKLIREAQAAGDEVWWYVCCGPTAPYANLFVDYPGIDHRMLGWQTFQYDITGFLYWGLDVWHYAGNNLPLDDYIKADYSNWNPTSFANFNGDGYLCYPGKKGTAVPSMRLALLRDGFEDCDMLNEAKALAKKAGKAGSKLMKMLKIGPSISKSLTDYASDGNILLQKREEIMQEMVKVQKAIK